MTPEWAVETAESVAASSAPASAAAASAAKTKKTAEDSKIEVGHGFVTSNPLPDVFLGMSAVLMEGLGKREALERFFVAFGGR